MTQLSTIAASEYSQAKPQDPFIELAKLASSHFPENADKAKEWLIDQVNSDIGITKKLVEVACNSIINRVFCQKRAKIVYLSSLQKDSRSYVKALARGQAASLLDWPLPGGKPLRHATLEDVRQASDFYNRQAQGMARTAIWLDAIASRLSPDRKVEQQFSAETLETLKKDADNA